MTVPSFPRRLPADQEAAVAVRHGHTIVGVTAGRITRGE